jgi:dolichol kinase
MKYALTSLCKPKVSSRTLSKLERVCLAAQAATREASFGMLLVFFCTLVYAMVGSKVGYALGGVEYLSAILGVMQVGNSLTALAAVKYAKKARLIGGNKKKEGATSEYASSSVGSSGDGGGRRKSSMKK